VIIKKKINKFPFIEIIKKLLSKLIFFLGTVTLLFSFLILFYYLNSGMYDRYKPIEAFQKFDKVVLTKYLGFSFFKINLYLHNEIKSLKYIFFKNKLDDIIIKIDQENLYNLELQRQNKLNYKAENYFKYSSGIINYQGKDYDIKLRVKGDRPLHWHDANKTSYKIDLKGEERIWGLEEFSIQKPITRNYIYEFIFHKFLEFNNLISLKYFFVNVSINDNFQGVYAVEEGFSKELIESNKRRNGPIFGLDEVSSVAFPNVKYDLYSEDYWKKNYSDLTDQALSKLENFKKNLISIDKIFDLDKWSTYFAIIDLTRSYHGSIPKSVKLYYNPVDAKFEPVGFDGHYNPNLFEEFLLLDFVDIENTNCSYICEERDWYLKFFNNKEFFTLYIEKLKKISAKSNIENFLNLNNETINFYNNQFLSENSKDDKVFYQGLAPYLYDEEYLINRSNYIKKRLENLSQEITSKILSKNKDDLINNLLNLTQIVFDNEKNLYFLNKDLEISENYFLPKNSKLVIDEGVKITFKNDVTIFSEGSIDFNGTIEKPIFISSNNKQGSIILSNNNYKLFNVHFENLSYPKDKNKVLYGGINIINSDVMLNNVSIKSSNSEDAINIISSNSIIEGLYVEDIFADAIDVDFGNLKFNNIKCNNILNDCLDISNANVVGNNLEGFEIYDKGLSFGENSSGNINNIDFQEAKLGLAVKDGSHLKVTNYILKNNEYDVAVFTKKNEYPEAKLELIDNMYNDEVSLLLGNNNTIIKNGSEITNKIKNKVINQIFY